MPFPPTRRILVLATALATAVIAAFRRPDALHTPQFFVEDGTVFFADDYRLGIHALYKPYAGYLHLVPRLVALMAGQCPLELRPSLYAWSTLLILVLLSLLTTGPRVELPHRPAYALLPLLIPIGGFVFIHLTNVQWFLGLGQLWMLLRRPASRPSEAVFDTSLLLLMGLTGPFCLVTLVLWPLRWRRYRVGIHEWICVAALGLCALTQLYYLSAPGTATPETGGFEHVSVRWLSRHAANFLLGYQWPQHLGPLNAVPAAALVVVLSLLVGGGARTLRFQTTIVVAFGIAFLLLGIYRVHPEARTANAFVSASRYFLIPHVCAACCGLLALPANGPMRPLAQGFLGILLLSAATRFDRHWPQDLHWERYCEKIRSGQHVIVPINWPGWHIDLNRPRSSAAPGQR